jgi:hypothetical protein
VLEHRVRPNTWSEFEFHATVTTAVPSRIERRPVEPFHPQVFRWAFGDGATLATADPHATHNFEARAQDRLYSQFLVTVEAVGRDGKVIRARRSLELLNPAFEALAYKGIVQLLVELNPRFPVLSEGGVVTQGVRLSHTQPAAVEITKVRVVKQYVDGAGRAPTEFPDVTSVLGATSVPAGHGLDLEVALDTRLEPETFSRDYYLEGKTSDGRPVRGSFSVMKPPALPTKDRHDPIADPVLLAKVKIARAVLHRDYVTDEDLWSLERAGRFADLHVDPRAAALPQGVPANLPKPALVSSSSLAAGGATSQQNIPPPPPPSAAPPSAPLPSATPKPERPAAAP